MGTSQSKASMPKTPLTQRVKTAATPKMQGGVSHRLMDQCISSRIGKGTVQLTN
jgi:hypothetical protein